MDCTAVRAPNLGTFYRSPKPGAPPYVQVGQRVEPSTEVCIIEVMKLFTSVHAGFRGVVRQVLVEDFGARRIRPGAVPHRTVDRAMTLRRILIANRGEIALRIVRAARKLGIETVLAASAVDRDSLAAREADRVVVLGPRGCAFVLSRRRARRTCGDRRRAATHCIRAMASFRNVPSLARLCEENGHCVCRAIVRVHRGGRRQTRGSASRQGRRRRDDAGQRQARQCQRGGRLRRGRSDFRSSPRRPPEAEGAAWSSPATPRSLADGFERASIEAKEAFGDGTLYHRALRRARASRRSAGHGARRRARAAFRRARLLDAASISEDD